jgi:hypothetical protein
VDKYLICYIFSLNFKMYFLMICFATWRIKNLTWEASQNIGPVLLSNLIFFHLPRITFFFFYFHWSPLGDLLPFRSKGLISQFLDNSQTVGLLGRVISSSQGLYLNTGQNKHRKTHTHTHTSNIPAIEPPIPASERATTVHALVSSATVTGPVLIGRWNQGGWNDIGRNWEMKNRCKIIN